VEHDPAQAGELPAGVRRLRRREGGHLRRGRLDRLLGDAGIVRNRAKVRSAIANAQAVLAMREGGETLSEVVWSVRPEGRSRPAAPGDVPAVTPEAEALSKALKARGFSFVGPTIVYAFMQAVGVVDDHLAACPFGGSTNGASARGG
jgi:DNA-3-methyladenine glycosylase I